MKIENLEQFKKQLSTLAGLLTPDDLVKQIEIDAEIDAADINEELAGQLSMLEPFGQENRQPVFFTRNLQLVDKRIVGNGSKHLKLWLRDQDDSSGRIHEGIGFGIAENNSDLAVGDRLDVVYHLEKDSWNGQSKIQLKVIDLMKVAD